MKKITFFCCTIAVSLLGIVGCTPEPVYELTPFGNPAEGINGTWKLLKVTQTDQIVKLAEKPQLDITAFLTRESPVTIKFDKSNMTYVSTGNARVNYLGNSGTFKFDNAEYPKSLILTDAGGVVYTLQLAAPIRPEYPNNPLSLKLNRTLRNKTALSYNFTFVR